MRKIDQLLNEYGQSHQNPINKAIHWVCVPIIFWSIVALLYSIPSGIFSTLTNHSWLGNWAVLTLLFVFIYYLRLSLSLAIGMLLFAVACIYLAYLISTELPISLPLFALIAFVLAWIGQFYGHHVEGKKPSFLKDLQFLLIGPAWLLHFIFKKIRIKY